MTDIKTGRQTIDMGSLFTTAGVAFHIGASLPFSRFVHGAIGRHKYRDWGDCGHHDREVNDDALINGGRIKRCQPKCKEEQCSPKVSLNTHH